MKIHSLVQGSPEWHAHRAAHFNASDAPAMMGCSPYKTRAELLREMHTGLSQDVDAATQRRFDDGHRFEALARPLAEKIIDADLYPVTGSEGKYSASFDGLTMDDDIGFEHKTLNDELRAAFNDMLTMEPEYRLPVAYRVQMEHQLLVSGASKILFMASKWNGDTLVEEKHCWYYPDMNLRRQIIAGWQQFEQDLIEYKPEPITTKPQAAPVESLPAVSVRMDGALTVASNLPEFGVALRSFIERIPTKPSTDQEFADTEAACKALKKAEEALATAEDGALASMTNVEELRRVIGDLRTLARNTRLAREKMVEARKLEIRTEEVNRGKAALAAHIAGLNETIGAPYFPPFPIDFGAPIKGLRSLDSVRDAIDQTLANAKIAANELANKIIANLRTLNEAGHEFLFADKATIVLKQADDLRALIDNRLAGHRAQEEKRLEAERERIRAEEAAKLQREAVQAPAPTLPANVVPMRPDPLAGKPIDDGQMIPLGKINARLGFSVTADFLWELGFQSKQEKNARLYPESQFPAICAALIKHIQSVSVEQIAA